MADWLCTRLQSERRGFNSLTPLHIIGDEVKKLILVGIVLALVATLGCLGEGELTEELALEIAANSNCTDEGTLTDDIFYNNSTGTWWIGLEPFEPNEMCNPACVVSEEDWTTEINWRCTGALPPEGDAEAEPEDEGALPGH